MMAGEQGEAAFAAAAGGAVRPVVGLVVRGEDLPAAGLRQRHLDALAGAVLAGVGHRRQTRPRRGSVQRGDNRGVFSHQPVGARNSARLLTCCFRRRKPGMIPPVALGLIYQTLTTLLGWLVLRARLWRRSWG
jgi:hypothetical protein